jgi:hypothetical protein
MSDFTDAAAPITLCSLGTGMGIAIEFIFFP